jgi:hypothetical protein
VSAGNCIDLGPNFSDPTTVDAKRYVAKLTLMRAGRGVALDDEVILIAVMPGAFGAPCRTTDHRAAQISLFLVAGLGASGERTNAPTRTTNAPWGAVQEALVAEVC